MFCIWYRSRWQTTSIDRQLTNVNIVFSKPIFCTYLLRFSVSGTFWILSDVNPCYHNMHTSCGLSVQETYKQNICYVEYWNINIFCKRSLPHLGVYVVIYKIVEKDWTLYLFCLMSLTLTTVNQVCMVAQVKHLDLVYFSNFLTKLCGRPILHSHTKIKLFMCTSIFVFSED